MVDESEMVSTLWQQYHVLYLLTSILWNIASRRCPQWNHGVEFDFSKKALLGPKNNTGSTKTILIGPKGDKPFNYTGSINPSENTLELGLFTSLRSVL